MEWMTCQSSLMITTRNQGWDIQVSVSTFFTDNGHGVPSTVLMMDHMGQPHISAPSIGGEISLPSGPRLPQSGFSHAIFYPPRYPGL